MRKFSLAVWTSIVCIGVFTEDVFDLLLKGQVSFHINLNPTRDLFFRLYPLSDASFFEMTGHFFMFSILCYLIYINTHYLHLTLLVTLTLAGTTELLQPYFGRGADIYDFSANMIGIFMVVFIIAAKGKTDLSFANESY